MATTSYNRIQPFLSSAAPGESDDSIRLRDLWLTLLRHRWVVAGVTLLVMAAAGLWSATRTPVYLTESTLRVEETDQGQQLLGNLAPIAGIRPGKIETEMAVLRSRQIRETVTDSLRLPVQLLEPKLPRANVLRPLVVPHDARTGVFELQRSGNGNDYAVRALSRGWSGARLPQHVAIGVPFQVGNVTLALEPKLAAHPPAKIRFAVNSFRKTVMDLRNSLVVMRPDPLAYMVSVRFSSSDPVMAADITNALTGAFLQYKAAATRGDAASTVHFLREQVQSYETQLAAAEGRLQAFREQQRVVSLEDEATQQVQRLATMQADYDRLRSERDALAKLLAQVQAGSRTGGGTSPYRQLASFPTFLSNRAVQDMLQALTELENQRATLLVRRTPANEEVQGVETRIHELELQLYQMARNYLDGLDSQIASAEASLGRFSNQLETIPSREVEFARLSREQKLLADIYGLLQNRLKEAEIREASVPSDIRVIDSALVPQAPISPKPARAVSMGLLLGLFLGVCAAFAREALDTKVRTHEDLAEVTRGAPVLGTIPRIRPSAATTAAAAAGHARNAEGERLITRYEPHHPASEAYRALRTNITFASAERVPQVLVITSAMPGDGKTTSASNLAVTLARQGTRTLLVDADLRRGLMHRVFGVGQEPGLTHVLMGHATLDTAIQHLSLTDAGETLDFLPSGVFPPNPAELLGSQRMRDLLTELRGRYDMIVFDAAPLSLVTDAAVLGTLADATVLVARTGVTDKRALQHAAAQIYQLGAPFGGVVLNDVDVERESRYYGYSYGYGLGYGYGSYGSREHAHVNGNGKAKP